jgi:predicted transposase/invertase (TIGR01784 family)
LVKEYVKSMNRDSAILKAIDVCIRQNVLKRFLEENASEVRNMLLTEWDSDKALKIAKEEAREDGWAAGMAEGFFQTAKAMLIEGMSLDLIAKITGLRKDEIESIR